MDQKEWVKTTYLAHLASLIDSNMSYLHTTLNWAVTVLLGGGVFITSRASFPDLTSYQGGLIMLIVLVHFGVRTAKAYLNVMRWTSLEKHILNAVISDEAEWQRILGKINDYHCLWISPLTLKSIVWKVMFELGFFYLFLITVLLICYTLVNVGPGYLTLTELAITLLLVVFEIWLGLLRSAYMRQVSRDDIAYSLR